MAATFARTARGPMGAFDDKIDSFKFYGEAKRILRQQAAQFPGGGIDLTEYIRYLCLVKAFGPDKMANLHREQCEAVRVKTEETRG